MSSCIFSCSPKLFSIWFMISTFSCWSAPMTDAVRSYSALIFVVGCWLLVGCWFANDSFFLDQCCLKLFFSSDGCLIFLFDLFSSVCFVEELDREFCRRIFPCCFCFSVSLVVWLLFCVGLLLIILLCLTFFLCLTSFVYIFTYRNKKVFLFS